MTPADSAFDLECDALNALTAAAIPDRARPYAIVRGGQPIGWFASLADATSFARGQFEPETYAIGNPAAALDYVPMFIVNRPFA